MTAPAPIDSAHYRQVLGHFATGVTVITAMTDAGPVGLAVNSFTSVSLDPPLVLFCAGSHSSTWPRIKAAGHYCVNILGADQESVSRQMSSKVPDKFEGVGWSVQASGAPVLAGALAWIDCTLEQEVDAGDHVLAIGRVLALGHADQSGGPLCYYRGGYVSLAH